MRTRLRSKVTLLFMTFAVLLAIPAVALADQLDNNLDPTADTITPARESVSVEAGKSTNVGIRVVPSGGDGDAGCNLDGGNEQVEVNVTSADTSKVTVSPSKLTFKGCDDPATTNDIENERTVTVTGVAVATDINIDFAEASNNSGGSFVYTGARFKVSVTPDVTAPTVTSVAPADGDTGVAIGSNVEAVFSEAMDASTSDGDPSTINASTFTLSKPDGQGGNTSVGGVVSYDSATKKATLNPNSDLDYSTT